MERCLTCSRLMESSLLSHRPPSCSWRPQRSTLLLLRSHSTSSFAVRAQGSSSDGSSKPSLRSGEKLWRRELLEEQLDASDSWSDENFLNLSVEQDIAEGAKQQQRQNKNQQKQLKLDRKEETNLIGSLVEKLLVFDFFFILFILAWFVAGLTEKAAFDTSTLIDVWLPLWPLVFQPALGFFMAGAIWTAVSKFLFKSR